MNLEVEEKYHDFGLTAPNQERQEKGTSSSNKNTIPQVTPPTWFKTGGYSCLQVEGVPGPTSTTPATVPVRRATYKQSRLLNKYVNA